MEGKRRRSQAVQLIAIVYGQENVTGSRLEANTGCNDTAIKNILNFL